jgi:long-chain acyl-CoA synthetase
MSWSHPFALVHGMLLPLFAGAACAIHPQSPTHEEFLEYLARHRINRFVDCPKFFYWLLTICMAAKYKLPGVKSVTIGAGTLSKPIRKAFGLLQIPVLQTYGRVEAVWTLAMADSESTDPTLWALPGFRYKVLNAEGDEAPGPGLREGPLAVMADAIMTAYFHPDKSLAEKATKFAIRGTWFYTGDAVRLEGEDDALKVKFLGALADVLFSGSRYLVPERIDEAAQGLNDILEAAGFVRLDEKNVPSFALAAVRQGKNISEAQVLQFVKAKLAGKEFPASIHFVDSLPKDKFGNVNRTALQRQFSVR